MSKNRKTGSSDDREINWIECSTCGHWDLFENFNTGIKYNPAKLDKLHIVCRLCKIDIAVQKCNDDIATARAMFDELERSNSKDADKLADLVKELDSWKPTFSRDASAVTPTQMKLTADEVFEINKRKKNVIISGLPETGNDIDDFLYFANTYHSLSTPLSANCIHSANRLGRSVNPQKPRLLCLTLHSVEWRRVILEMWKTSNPCSSPRPNYYARPDLTKAQLQADRLLRQQLLVAGKDKYMIQRGRIVERSITAKSLIDPLRVVPARITADNSVPAAVVATDVTACTDNLFAATATASHPTTDTYLSAGPASKASAQHTRVSVSGNAVLTTSVAIVATKTVTVPTVTVSMTPGAICSTTTISTSPQIHDATSLPSAPAAYPIMPPASDTRAGVAASISNHNIVATPSLPHSKRTTADSAAKITSIRRTPMMTAATRSSTGQKSSSVAHATTTTSVTAAHRTIPTSTSAPPRRSTRQVDKITNSSTERPARVVSGNNGPSNTKNTHDA